MLPLLLGLLFLVAPAVAAAATAPAGPRVLSTTVDHTITPVIANHIHDGIRRAEREGYDAFLIRLDTPGGLDGSMRSIIQDIFASEVPVIVYVSPAGARAASAGALITLAGHVAAMAPGTAIGAATPVGAEGGEDLDRKIVNDAAAYSEAIAERRGRDVTFAVEAVREGRSVPAPQALAAGVVDVLASSTTELLDAIDGTAVTVGPEDREVVLRTAGAAIDDDDLGVLRTIQQFLADPNVAFLLLSVGTLGLIYELASPGIGVGAGVGVSFIVVALFGLAVLPVNIVGIAFLLLAALLFVVEVLAPGIGIAAGGGVLALILSAVFLVRDAPGIEVSLAVVLPGAVVLGLATVGAGRLAVRVRSEPSSTTGAGALLGQRAIVRDVRGRPAVHVAGTWWNARIDDGAAPAPGTTVRVTGMDGLDLIVVADSADPAIPASPGEDPHPDVPPNTKESP